MPDTTFLLFLCFMIVAIIGASVLAIVFSRLNGIEDTLNIHREEYANTKHRLYSLESELYRLRRERFGTWNFSSETIATSAPRPEKKDSEEKSEDEQSAN